MSSGSLLPGDVAQVLLLSDALPEEARCTDQATGSTSIDDLEESSFEAEMAFGMEQQQNEFELDSYDSSDDEDEDEDDEDDS